MFEQCVLLVSRVINIHGDGSCPTIARLSQGTDGVQQNVSHCGETQLGWYRNEPGTAWGCFYGKKLDPVPPEDGRDGDVQQTCWIGR